MRELPGNNYEFTQPIQMRFNELLAGVRGDVAVKVFGDEFDPLLRAADQIASVLQGHQGRQGCQSRASQRPVRPGHRRGQG